MIKCKQVHSRIKHKTGVWRYYAEGGDGGGGGEDGCLVPVFLATTRNPFFAKTYERPLQIVVPATVHLKAGRKSGLSLQCQEWGICRRRYALQAPEEYRYVVWDQRSDGCGAHEQELECSVHLSHDR